VEKRKKREKPPFGRTDDRANERNLLRKSGRDRESHRERFFPADNGHVVSIFAVILVQQKEAQERGRLSPRALSIIDIHYSRGKYLLHASQTYRLPGVSVESAA